MKDQVLTRPQLSIAGVRSFDPRRTETIEFGRPLTLIVGQNGVGKTVSICSLPPVGATREGCINEFKDYH